MAAGAGVLHADDVCSVVLNPGNVEMRETLTNIVYVARRFKMATALNLLGLVMAYAVFYLFTTQIHYQDSYNHSLKDYERLYRLETDHVYNEWEYSDLVCYPFSEGLDSMPEVEAYSMTEVVGQDFDFIKGDKMLHYRVARASGQALSMLTDGVKGTIAWDGDSARGLMIPRSIAMEYFGTTDVLDRPMLMAFSYLDPVSQQPIDTVYKYEVRGVYEDFPENCELRNYIYSNRDEEELLSLNNLHKCIIKFRTVPADMEAFGERLKQSIVDKFVANMERYGEIEDAPQMIASIRAMNVRFTPLKDSYFKHNSFTTGDRGYKGMASILKLVCLLVIIIAAINFLNFTLAESPMRVRSLNTRLVLGASRTSLRLSLVAESVITSVGACLLALVLCWMIQALPLTRSLTEGDLSLGAHGPQVLMMFVVALVVGFLAGVYPAIFATSFAPAVALKSGFGLTPQGHKLRSLLVFLQLLVSLMLIGYIGILYMQSSFIYNSNYGYDKDQILISRLPHPYDAEQLSRELASLPGVDAISFSNNSVGFTDGHNVQRGDKNGHDIRFGCIEVNNDYLKTLGIRVIEGRPFSDGDSTAIIINESARKAWPWLRLGDKLSTGINSTDSAAVIGVCEDIRYSTTRIKSNHPFLFILRPDLSTYADVFLTVRMAPDADHEQVGHHIQQLVAKHYGDEVSLFPFDQQLRDVVYKNEFRYVRQVLIISLICMMITLIGVFCLTMFETEYRRKEIGVRKVMGARSWDIIMMFCKWYAWLLIVAFVVAMPLASYFGWKTLQYFAEHIGIPWWVFPMALLLVGGVTLGTVVLQSWRTARENPVNSFKIE